MPSLNSFFEAFESFIFIIFIFFTTFITLISRLKVKLRLLRNRRSLEKRTIRLLAKFFLTLISIP